VVETTAATMITALNSPHLLRRKQCQIQLQVPPLGADLWTMYERVSAGAGAIYKRVRCWMASKTLSFRLL